ncbi:hypothetical protein J6590_011876 [Homalodisca vitripennis]|nr:hypothetical protein J6590_011876 [Homalodisca vitripennis]
MTLIGGAYNNLQISPDIVCTDHWIRTMKYRNQSGHFTSRINIEDMDSSNRRISNVLIKKMRESRRRDVTLRRRRVRTELDCKSSIPDPKVIATYHHPPVQLISNID